MSNEQSVKLIGQVAVPGPCCNCRQMIGIEKTCVAFEDGRVVCVPCAFLIVGAVA